MHSSPQYFEKYSVVGCARKYEKSKKCVFLVRKESRTKGHVRHLTKKYPKISENSKNLVDDYKKGHQKFLPSKRTFFKKKRHLGPRKIFPSPQTRRQVSATGSD